MQPGYRSGLIGVTQDDDVKTFASEVATHLAGPAPSLWDSAAFAQRLKLQQSILDWLNTLGIGTMIDVYTQSQQIQDWAKCQSLPQTAPATPKGQNPVLFGTKPSCESNQRSIAVTWAAGQYRKAVCKASCADAGAQCGSVDDLCGKTLDCGTCQSPNQCVSGQCVNPNCPSNTCASMGLECGDAPDGCGGVLHCGDCPAGSSCGAAGPNKCGPAPARRQPIGSNAPPSRKVVTPGFNQQGPAVQTTSSAWPWILGIAALGAIGIGAYYYTRAPSPAVAASRPSHRGSSRAR